MPLPIGDQ